MNKIVIKLTKYRRNLIEWSNKTSPRINYLIDRYQIIKVGCILGTCIVYDMIVINGYLIYDGFMNILVLNKVKN